MNSFSTFLRLRLLIAALFCTFLAIAEPTSENLFEALEASPQAALVIERADGENLYRLNPGTPLIPASTLKILTAIIAIDHWGLAHRFHTDFLTSADNALVIKGYGDPYLVSEEIERIAATIAKTGRKSFSSIRLDTSWYSEDTKIDGQSRSDNPYDAPAAAIAANFNTVFLRRKGSIVESVEVQTPLTPVANKIGRSLPTGQHRVNIKTARSGSVYFAEILREKLLSKNVNSGREIRFATAADDAKLLYRHYNSHTLEQILTAMLKYSTNFIANQLFLNVGAEVASLPASISQSQRVVARYAQRQLGWENAVIKEGAGLSRNNQVCASQLVALLQRFRPYAHLLPTSSNGMVGKTGTLNGISSFAGYVSTDASSPAFALLINDAQFSGSRTHWLHQIQQHSTTSRSSNVAH